MQMFLAMVMLLVLPHLGRTRVVHTRQTRLGAWSLRVRTDTFASDVSCRLFRRHIDYLRGVVVFHLPRRANTFGAVYRIDGGPPRAASADAPDLAKMGFSIYADDLANPSGGLVRIPEGRLASASNVAIEVKGVVTKFNISGLGPALQAANKAGCGSEAFDR
ncbi:MAG: hypothetical protein ACREEB_08830 [Caulobacteraceae bacterium]